MNLGYDTSEPLCSIPVIMWPEVKLWDHLAIVFFKILFI